LKIISANPPSTLKKRHLQLSDRVFRIKASIGTAAKRKWEAGAQTGTEAIVVRLEHRKFYRIATAAQTLFCCWSSLLVAAAMANDGSKENHIYGHITSDFKIESSDDWISIRVQVQRQRRHMPSSGEGRTNRGADRHT
jgi:hypothetical protein